MNVFYLLLFMLFIPVNDEQDSLLPLNDAGKVVFEEEVVVENIGKDALLVNTINFFTRVKKANQRKPGKARVDQEVISKEGSFLVYKKGLFTPQIHGEIKYTLTVEVKEKGYKYTYTDFVFQFYEKNRYGQFAPVSGKVKNLEEERYPGMQKIWESHKELTRQAIEKHIIELKKKLKEVPPGVMNSADSHFEDSY